MGKTSSSRDWAQIYAIYGLDQWQTVVFLLLQALLFSVLAIVYLTYFNSIRFIFEHFLSLTSIPTGSARFAAGFTGCVIGLSALCLFFAAANFFFSSLTLHYEMALRMVNTVNDWSAVKHALDLGCGRGILLNTVATQLKKAGSSGRVVGLDPSKRTTLSTLRTAIMEGVGEYVTCREGDARRLPFGDNYFDVVVSGVFVHTVGKEHGQRTVEAAAERMRAVGEMVRVLKPGGVGVVWDVLHVPEYVRRLQEMKVEEIRVSEPVTAFMVSSHILSFTKPSHHHIVGPGMARKVGSLPTMSMTEDYGVGNEISLIRRVDYLISQGETFLTNSTPGEVSPEFGEWLTTVENFLKEAENKLADKDLMVKKKKLDKLYKKGKIKETLVAEKNAGETSQTKKKNSTGVDNGANRASEGQAYGYAGGSQLVIGTGGFGKTTITKVDSTLEVTGGPNLRALESAPSNSARSQMVFGDGGFGETDIQSTRSHTIVRYG